MGEITACASVMRDKAIRIKTGDRRHGYRRHRGRRSGNLQHLDDNGFCRSGRRRPGGKARQPERLQQERRGGRIGKAGDQHPDTGRKKSEDPGGDRSLLHVRPDLPQFHEVRGAGEKRTGRPHDFQHPRAAGQSCGSQHAAHGSVSTKSWRNRWPRFWPIWE